VTDETGEPGHLYFGRNRTSVLWTDTPRGFSALGGTTIGFSINFLSAGRGKDLVATATVRQRGREISTGEVTVCDSGGKEIAVALVTYKLSPAT